MDFAGGSMFLIEGVLGSKKRGQELKLSLGFFCSKIVNFGQNVLKLRILGAFGCFYGTLEFYQDRSSGTLSSKDSGGSSHCLQSDQVIVSNCETLYHFSKRFLSTYICHGICLMDSWDPLNLT